MGYGVLSSQHSEHVLLPNQSQTSLQRTLNVVPCRPSAETTPCLRRVIGITFPSLFSLLTEYAVLLHRVVSVRLL